MKGYIQIYTGNGKGKTTASIGLTIRAIGAGKKVFFAQFVKGMIYSEIKALEQFGESVTVKQYGLNCFIRETPKQVDIDAARKGLKEVTDVIKSGQYDVIVLEDRKSVV